MRSRTDADRYAVTRAHKRQARAYLYRVDGTFVGDVPISGGQVEHSLSRADGERSGSIVLGGYALENLWSPENPSYAVIEMQIDGSTWLLGEYPVLKVKTSTPGGRVDATLGDWCYRRSRSVAELPANTLITGTSIASMAAQHLTHVMQKTVVCTRDDTGGAMMPAEAPVSAGGDVWAAMQQMAALADARLTLPTSSTVELRRYDPKPVADETTEGVLIRGSRSISAAKGDACNRAIVTVDGTAGESFRSVRTLTAGPFAYSLQGAFGPAQLVENVRVAAQSQAAADREAERLANRRFGAGLEIDVEISAMPWLMVGDSLAVTIGDRTDVVVVETITYPLTANQPMRITGRDGGWTGHAVLAA